MSERLEHELRWRHRAVAALLGFAVGDAYGVAVGRSEQPFGGTDAEVSDATQMMLACCEGMLRTFVRARVGHKNPALQDMIWHAVARWGAEQGDMELSADARGAATQPAWLSEQPIMRVRNRHGSAAAKALAHGPRTTSSAGSAALYRVAPLSLCIVPFDLSAVRSVVALTHDAPDATLAAVACTALSTRRL
jgi:ADP-ribosylglycohydrolase